MHEKTYREVHQIDRAHGRVEEDLQNCLRLASEQERVQERVTSGAPAGTTMAMCKPATARAQSHARLDFAPHGALGGFAQAAAALVTSALGKRLNSMRRLNQKHKEKKHQAESTAS